MPAPRTPDVETLASAVAAAYAGRWARVAAGNDAPWLVDGFAGADLQRAAIRGVTADPPALALIQAAAEVLGDSVRVVLVEEDPGLLARVEDALGDAGMGGRLRRASRAADAAPGEIVLVESPFAALAGHLEDVIGGSPALVRLAPLAAKALPWDALQPLAALPAADVLLRFPAEDFVRQGRFGGPLADFPPHLRRVAEACSVLLADPRHGWLLAWREAQRSGGEGAALARVVERLCDQIAGVYGHVERLANAARVESGADAVHLLLTTSDPDRAAGLDAVIAEAGAPPPPRASSRAKSPRAAAKSVAPDGAPAPAAPAASAATPAGAEPRPAPLVSLPDAEPQPTSAPAARAEEPQPMPSGEAIHAEASSAAAEPAADAQPEPSIERTGTAAAPEPEPRLRESLIPRLPLRVDPWDLPAEPPPPAQSAALLDLFAGGQSAAPDAPAPRGPNLRALADDLHARRAGQRIAARQVLSELADAGLTPEQARTALGALKRSGRAAYRSLDADGAEVEFLYAPAPMPAPAPAAPRTRKTRAASPDLLGFFDDDPSPAQAAPFEIEPEPPPPPPAEKKPRRRKSAE